LTGTHLDAAAFWGIGLHPVIALTLLNDRLARFWQGLLHELAHLGRHGDLSAAAFLDDLDLPRTDPLEQKADEWAREALIPSIACDAWTTRREYQEQDVFAFAQELDIHPIILAERLRDDSERRVTFALSWAGFDLNVRPLWRVELSAGCRTARPRRYAQRSDGWRRLSAAGRLHHRLPGLGRESGHNRPDRGEVEDDRLDPNERAAQLQRRQTGEETFRQGQQLGDEMPL
jgi:hypothetical protein